MSEVFHPQRLESSAPRERRNLLLAGLVMTTLSAFIAWVGASGLRGRRSGDPRRRQVLRAIGVADFLSAKTAPPAMD